MKHILRFILAVLWILLISATDCIYGNEIFKSLTIENGLAYADANCMGQDSYVV